ncbi:predicted protein [Thalassiosira pseudonana CCMP1335]|uniref:Uncharacterized protein n=1 Tax=Thalassiosira pseudonana TaxID=35128 RepID=B8BUC8_THAPS|nr:predicted protein [Thalassiosira pseudonana CCMP1335]EED95264.1 predicted protein [Thalassiosira pseudonana CCMP1335]
MDAIVQFTRNALCTLKNFNILSDTFLYDANVTAHYYTFPEPLNQTTPLEVLISITQFYAFITVSAAGYKMMTTSGVLKLQLINRLLNISAKKEADNDNSKKKGKKEEAKAKAASEATARRLVAESLLKEGDAAARSFFIGFNVLAIGLSFFWLTANSYHVTSTDWIGGIQGLIHALTVAEVCLLVMLYYMVKDGAASIRRSFQMKQFASDITPSEVGNVTVEQYSWLVDGWSPFWAEGSSGSAMDVAAEEKMLEKEEEAVASRLGALSKNVGPDIAPRIRHESRIALFEGYREYVYLVLNFFAFYGYFASILVFYFDDESKQPEYIRALLLQLPNADADWLGNAVGDFMWTVEPILILGSPLIVKSMSSKKKESKEKVA